MKEIYEFHTEEIPATGHVAGHTEIKGRNEEKERKKQRRR
jgi:hypothetical protein